MAVFSCATALGGVADSAMSAVAMPQMDDKERMLNILSCVAQGHSASHLSREISHMRGNRSGAGCADVSVPNFAQAILSLRRYAPAECGARKCLCPFYGDVPLMLKKLHQRARFPPVPAVR
jgi:hypothetical protein